MRSCIAGSHARQVLRDGDLLLTVAGRPVTHFAAVEAAISAACSGTEGAYGEAAAPQQEGRASADSLVSLGCGSSEEAAECSAATHFGTGDGGNAGRCPKRRRGVAGAAIDMLPMASDASTLEAVLNR